MTSARLLIVDPRHGLLHIAREKLVDVLRAGDLVVANDAATLPASLHGTHVPTGEAIEVRLAGRASLSPELADFSAVVFGAGDFHTRTEDRPPPPPLVPGDVLALGPLPATVTGLLGHPRLISLHFASSPDEIWSGIAHHGRPVQYAHVPTPLALWDVWTPIASPPVAFEPPSASFALDWQMIAALRARIIGFATITHAAGISSTGDVGTRRTPSIGRAIRRAVLDRARDRARAIHRRQIVAIGTTVVRALEHSARNDGIVHAGPGVATGRVGPRFAAARSRCDLDGRPRARDEPLRAAARVCRRLDAASADDVLAAHGYRPHEFGDSVLVIGM